MQNKDFKNWSTLRIFLSYFSPHKRLFILDMCCAFFVALVDLIYPLISRAARENDNVLDAAFSGDLAFAREKFCELNMIKALSDADKRALFDEMVAGTKDYLTYLK